MAKVAVAALALEKADGVENRGKQMFTAGTRAVTKLIYVISDSICRSASIDQHHTHVTT